MQHFDYYVPFTNELAEENLVPYRTNSPLKRKIDYVFRHATHIYRDEYIDVSTSGSRSLLEDMSTRAVAMVRHFLLYPQQYGHKLENIHLQILIRMWKQLFKHKIMQKKSNDRYYPTKLKLLDIDNNLLEELVRTVEDKDYIQHHDDMVKRRETTSVFTGKQVGLRERISLGTHEGGRRFKHYIDLARRYG